MGMSHYTRFEAGASSEWSKLEFPHPRFSRPVRGKFFLGAPLALTGMEVSVNSLPPGAAVPFLHTHREHEELYVFLEGRGDFQVDGERFEVGPGSCVRVAPEGKRSWRNSSSEPLLALVIQAKAGSLAGQAIEDGVVCSEPVSW
jgi:mannose-6-phosphate isomerase-like protein (cupin superfamily)